MSHLLVGGLCAPCRVRWVWYRATHNPTLKEAACPRCGLALERSTLKGPFEIIDRATVPYQYSDEATALRMKKEK